MKFLIFLAQAPPNDIVIRTLGRTQRSTETSSTMSAAEDDNGVTQNGPLVNSGQDECLYQKAGRVVGGDGNDSLVQFGIAYQSASAEVQVEQGLRYLKAKGVTRDVRKAAELFRRAANAGNLDGCVHLGHCHLNGLGVEKNVNTAVELFRMAAEKGNSGGMVELGSLLRNGYGVDKNFEEAVRLFREAIKLGNMEAEVELGICYMHGCGVPKDVEEGIRRLRLSADAGCSLGQSELAYRTDVGMSWSRMSTKLCVCFGWQLKMVIWKPTLS